MASDGVRLCGHIVSLLPSFAFTILKQRILAFLHKRSYKPLPPSQLKNIVVVGGSFAGFQVCKRLTETLPTGYRVILVEKNSHLNYVFAFPRFSVVRGYEQHAFIPYVGLGAGAPKGIFEHYQDTVMEVNEHFVTLKNGEELAYEYLVVATGTSSDLPSKVQSTESESAQQELKGMQDRIAAANSIAVIGGGAVGVELATDIKSVLPEKQVTLIHSREQLLHTFGPRLHKHVLETLDNMDVTTILNQRPTIPEKGGSLVFSGGKEDSFDLIIPCTGQRPNSSILSSLSPPSISKQTAHILVNPTLQLYDEQYPYIYALGDVAATGGPKMGRAAFMQSEIVVHNIVTSIHGVERLETYRPTVVLEGSLKLTLGKSKILLYARESGGRELLVSLNSGKVDMDVKRQWATFGATANAIREK